MSKVWFITGAGSGIGAATARAALKAGDRVVATGRNLDKVRNALGDVAGENVAFVQLDVTNEAQAKPAVDAGDQGVRTHRRSRQQCGLQPARQFRGVEHRRNREA